MNTEKEELEFNMDRSSKRMARAEKLVVLLADEGVRWAETVKVIQADIEKFFLRILYFQQSIVQIAMSISGG